MTSSHHVTLSHHRWRHQLRFRDLFPDLFWWKIGTNLASNHFGFCDFSKIWKSSKSCSSSNFFIFLTSKSSNRSLEWSKSLLRMSSTLQTSISLMTSLLKATLSKYLEDFRMRFEKFKFFLQISISLLQDEEEKKKEILSYPNYKEAKEKRRFEEEFEKMKTSNMWSSWSSSFKDLHLLIFNRHKPKEVKLKSYEDEEEIFQLHPQILCFYLFIKDARNLPGDKINSSSSSHLPSSRDLFWGTIYSSQHLHHHQIFCVHKRWQVCSGLVHNKPSIQFQPGTLTTTVPTVHLTNWSTSYCPSKSIPIYSNKCLATTSWLRCGPSYLNWTRTNWWASVRSLWTFSTNLWLIKRLPGDDVIPYIQSSSLSS